MDRHQITKIKPADRPFVYEQGKDLTSTLHNIVEDMRDEADKAMYNNWSITPKQLKSCSLKVHGTGENPKIELKVSEMAGGYRTPAENPCVLSSRASDTVKLLDKFEKALKKEFKKRTGKTLTLKKPELRVDWQQVALNGLYQFFAIKVAECTTKLDPQEWERK